MKVNILKVRPDVIIPKKATELSAGYDVYACEDFMVKPGRQVMPLGFAMELPAGYDAKIRSRSGYAAKGFVGFTPDGENDARYDADVIDGVVDADYRGEVSVIIVSRCDKPFLVKKGQRVAQMLIEKAETAEFDEVDELSETERAGGAFGHSGI